MHVAQASIGSAAFGSVSWAALTSACGHTIAHCSQRSAVPVLVSNCRLTASANDDLPAALAARAVPCVIGSRPKAPVFCTPQRADDRFDFSLLHDPHYYRVEPRDNIQPGEMRFLADARVSGRRVALPSIVSPTQHAWPALSSPSSSNSYSPLVPHCAKSKSIFPLFSII
jgi:hypothetical protein